MPADVDYIFGVLLKKEIEYKSDEIAERVEKIVNNHFDAQPKEKLDTTQINRFTGIAYSSDNMRSLQEFLKRQAGKERRGKKKTWTANDLHEHLLKQISYITKKDSVDVYQEALSQVEKIMTGEFDKANRERIIREISIELLKRFATHFGIHYLYKAGG